MQNCYCHHAACLLLKVYGTSGVVGDADFRTAQVENKDRSLHKRSEVGASTRKACVGVQRGEFKCRKALHLLLAIPAYRNQQLVQQWQLSRRRLLLESFAFAKLLGWW